MSSDKDKAKDQKTHRNPENSGSENEQETGYGKSGGNMGAGKSSKENLGIEKPTDGGQAGSRKPKQSE
jgi:hypothetical protein